MNEILEMRKRIRELERKNEVVLLAVLSILFPDLPAPVASRILEMIEKYSKT
jgi:hypothetical protein